MSIVGAFVLPHPPLAIPDVGRGQEREIPATIEGYNKVGKRVAELAPETIVVISPHAIMYSDYIHISPGKSARGDMGQFRCPHVSIEKEYDVEFVKRLAEEASEAGLSAGTEGDRKPKLDHGTILPLYYVEKYYKDYKLVRCSLSGLPLIDHYEFGTYIGKVAEELERRTVVIASGDLSHRLREDGPYGFNPEGPKFDERITHDIDTGNFGDLLEFDENFCEEAGECGHRSFIEMAGSLDGKAVSPKLLSYEGIFGVGYATAIIEVVGDDPTRHFGEEYIRKHRSAADEKRKDSDLFVRLAWLSVENYVKGGLRLSSDDPEVVKLLKEDPAAADELLNTQSGAFVSIHENGDLRGCIGTISATRKNLADEILQNAVSACSRDPRFSPIVPRELDYLDISVDVLGKAEPIDSMDQLDVKRYGVIVTHHGKRGLLLPDLEGVDTPEEQVRIACRKAGINPNGKFDMERFEVVRHL
ncbi:MAG: AmmeMemoRadiSam system protein A [Coriobacteriales bacterium]|jgi:AmmeMemoRadiSam system protein A